MATLGILQDQGGQHPRLQVGDVRLTWLILVFLLVRVLVLRRLFDDLSLRLRLSFALGLDLRLALRLTHRAPFTIMVALIAFRHVFAEVAFRRTELQAAAAIALSNDQTSVVRYTIRVAPLTTLSRSRSSGTTPFASV